MAKDATEAQASTHIQSTKDRKSRLTKNSTYRNDCSDGFKGPDKPDGRRWEAHHIVCEHSMASRDTNTYVENCLWITEWDINASENLIGLPRNRQFRQEGETPGGNWVSHQVDHNTSDGYTEECRAWLQENVFDDLNKAKKNHSTDADDILTELQGCTTRFIGLLATRALRPLSAPMTPKIGWAKRFDAGYEDTWYHPLSMGANPRKRSPGVSKTNLAGVLNQI